MILFSADEIHIRSGVGMNRETYDTLMETCGLHRRSVTYSSEELHLRTALCGVYCFESDEYIEVLTAIAHTISAMLSLEMREEASEQLRLLEGLCHDLEENPGLMEPAEYKRLIQRRKEDLMERGYLALPSDWPVEPLR